MSTGTGRALWTVAKDLGLAYVAILALSALGLCARLAWFDAGVAPALDPFADEARARLTVPPDDPAAGRALALARERTAGDDRTALSLETRDGAPWLVLRSRDRADTSVVVDAARAAGVFEGGVVVSLSGFDLGVLARADADALVSSLGWVLPWLIASGGLGFLAVGVWARRRRPAPLGDPAAGPSRLAAIGLGVGVLAVGLSWSISVALEALGAPSREQEWVVRLAGGTGSAFVVLLVGAGLIAPLGEEVFFRGHLFRWLRAETTTPLAYDVSAGAFALVHQNPAAIAQYLAYGVLFAWAYARWRSLAVPVVAHAVVNVTGVLLLRLGASGAGGT